MSEAAIQVDLQIQDHITETLDKITVFLEAEFGAVPTPRVAEKARELVDQHRVWLHDHQALVGGDTHLWTVTATTIGVECDCPAGQNTDPTSCSHKVAAMVAWAS